MVTLANQPVSQMNTPYPRRWAALGVLCLSLLIVVMANTALIVAAPSMTQDLGLTSADLQWVIDGYTVPYAALMLLFGVIGDKYSRRGALLTGLGVFAAGAVFGSLADTTTLVIAARMMMGVGAAMIMPATLSLLVATFPKPERSRAIAVWAATSGLAIALGPLLAGWLLESSSWGSTFLINVPIAVVAAVGALALVPPSKSESQGAIDWVGGLLSVVTIGGLVFAIIDGFHFGITSATVIAGLGSIVGALLFLAWELEHPRSLLDVRKLGDRTVGGATLAVLILFLTAFGIIYTVAQQFQFVLAYGPLETGVRLLPLAICVSIGAAVGGRMVGPIGIRFTIAFGMAVAATGAMILTVVDADSGYSVFLVSLILTGLGIGLSVSPSTDAIMGSFDERDLGAAGGLNDTAIEFGGALGIALLGSVLASNYKDGIAGFLASLPLGQLTGPQAEQAQQAVDIAGNSVGGATLVAQELADDPIAGSFAQPMLDAAGAAFTEAITHAGLVGGAMLGLGAVVVAFVLPTDAPGISADQPLEHNLA
ncbi:MAG: MFS transporter [Rhodococcus sp.]|nr:MFS transporter [Rhodococcus sp. (in: high G+C Gram-positive bacteria)]